LLASMDASNRLNPCCDGTCTLSKLDAAGKPYWVLILVVMEHAL